MSKINRCLSIGFLVLALVGCGAGGTTTTTGGSTATDTIPPTVTSCNPSNSATNVVLNSSITATFSEAMNPSTIATSTITLMAGASTVSGALTYTGTTATFTPFSALTPNTTYMATVGTGVQDMAGNQMLNNYTWSFATGAAPDVTPPTVSSTSPVNNATGVAVNTAISLTFSETLNSSTVTTATVTLKSGSNNISGAVTYSGTTATFTPSSILASNTTYTVTIKTGVKDLAGNALASNYVWSFMTVPILSATIPDTGQTTCYSSSGSVISCTGTGQDGEYIINSSYSDNGNGTITDNVTNLMWQKQDDATIRRYDDAVAYCDSLSLGGYSDWAIPSVNSLVSIANYGVAVPAISTPYFLNTQSSDYWSSSTFSDYVTYAWYVNFGYGHVTYCANHSTGYFYVRCMRGAQASVQGFTDNGNGTMSDNRTGKKWQKQDDGTVKSWTSALTYCKELSLGGLSDWHLPNIKELRSIVNNTSHSSPRIDPLFISTQPSYYWSSTTYANGTSKAWVVGFNDGIDGNYNKADLYYVRCVR